MSPERDIQSDRLPGGSLLSAALNRNVMGLADRGGSSGIVGARWADLAAAHADQFVGGSAPIPGSPKVHHIERVARLDSDPRIARRASRLGLQNPDLIFTGRMNGTPTIQAVDAKFSIETAKSKQVSVEMMESLRTLGPMLDEAVGGFDDGSQVLPGLFISPDSEITRYVIRRGRGITKLTVDPSEVVLMDISAAEMFGCGEERELMSSLSTADCLPVDPFSNLLAGLYYFRLSRIAVAAYVDMHRPLLAYDDRCEPDIAVICAETTTRLPASATAWRLVNDWIGEAESVNRQRSAIDRVAGLPVTGKDLREWIEQDAKAAGGEAPSVNQVRRRLGGWHRAQLREQLGPVMPPCPDIGALLDDIGRLSRDLTPLLRPQCAAIVARLIAEQPTGADEAESAERDDAAV
ncbi:MAG: hypothetical protein KF883_06300 [Thermomicrobiales bacterium]|nr:hypothetical protein [Thermomicrobiales bacterium]